VASAPIRHFSFFDLVNSAPGVSATSTRRIVHERDDAREHDERQRVPIDGTDLSAPTGGTAWPWPNRCNPGIEVLQLGASAEYGNVMGACLQRRHAPGRQRVHGDGTYDGPDDAHDGDLPAVATCDADGARRRPADGQRSTWRITLRHAAIVFVGSLRLPVRRRETRCRPGA